MKVIHKISMKPLSMKAQKEAMALGISQYDYRWLKEIREAGLQGVSWGCLPRNVYAKLIEKDLIIALPPGLVWVKRKETHARTD
jgi:hypothetical protein